jgi:hypothetical protein
MCVDVHVSGNVTDHSVEEGNLPGFEVPNCHHFLDALNWLHRHGYTARESDTDSMHEGSSSFDYLLFSKKVQERTTSTGLSTLIRTKMKATHEDDCKQFAAMAYLPLSPTEGRTCVQADVGTLFEHANGEGTLMTQLSSENHGTLMDGMNWLHKEGYTTQEDSLGALYARITADHDSGPSFKVRIYSRPL